MRPWLRNQDGYLMLLVVIAGAIFLAILTYVNAASLTNLKTARTSLVALDALSVAEAGADNAIFNLNKTNSYSGTNTSCPISSTGSNPVTLYNDSVKGKGTYETCITNGTIANEKIVYSTGKVYLPASSSRPSIRKLKIVLIGTFAGSYGVQTGPGGLIMSNSATIANGDVYVGGKITMSNNSAIGSAGNPLNVWAGDYVCPNPADSTYPQLCASGQPISLSNSAHIYANVNANNQTDGSGMSSAGLVSSSGVANSTLPAYDRAAQKAAVTGTMTASAASCSGNQTRTWPANVHITGGNVALSNNCVVTVQGNVWIDGGLTLSNKSIIKVADSLNSMPTLMIDGPSGVSFGNQTSLSSNASQIGAQIITFWANSGCSPDCSNLTGTGLANSQNVTTISLGNQGLSAGSIVYARWSKVTVGNGGTIGQVEGQTIEFNNSGNITFGTGTNGSDSYTYTVRYYEQI